VRLLGLDIEVVGEPADLVRYLGTVYRPFAADGDAAERVAIVRHGTGFRVAFRGEWVLAPASDAELLAFVSWWINETVFATPFDRLLVHAGVVAREGRAVLLPGIPNAGKSTLVAALVGSGWDYLSDEAAVLDVRTGRVEPFARTLTLDAGSLALLPGVTPLASPVPGGIATLGAHVAPEALRAGCVGGAAVPVALVFPTVRPGAGTRRRELAKADALVGLGEQAFNLDSLGPAAFRCLARLVTRCVVLGVDVDDLADAVRVVEAAADRGT
jgi:hypothetical protein